MIRSPESCSFPDSWALLQRVARNRILDAIRKNGLSFIDEKGGKTITNYPCVIISSRKEIRILPVVEFEAISSLR